jgi:amino acid adenylation domain-containing protein
MTEVGNRPSEAATTGVRRQDRVASLSEARRALLQLQLREAREARAARERIQPVARTGRLPLSFAQQRLWFLDQFAPGLPVYNSPLPLRLRGPLDTRVLRQALTRLVERHEIMRTRYLSEHGAPYQVIDPPPAAPVPLHEEDLGAVPAAEREERMLAFVAAQARRPFDLTVDPGLRASLVRLHDEDHVLMLAMHHITTDGWSTGIVASELVQLYLAFAAGRPDPLPPLPIQYVDYAAWQRTVFTGEERDKQLAYWTQRLADLPGLDFPTDRPRPPAPSWSGSIIGASLPERLREGLTALARAEQVTLLTVLLAAFQTVLYRYTSQADLVLGSVFSGRTRSEIEPLIGFFSNSLVLRTDMSGDPTFRQLLARTNDVVLGGHFHQDLPFGMLVDALRPERDPSRNPLFQISFTLQNAQVESLSLGQLRVEFVPLTVGTARFDLAFQLTEVPPDGFKVWIEYSTELFDRDRMSRLIGHYENVLSAVLADPDARLSTVDLMGAGERRTVLVDWNDAGRAYPTAGDCLHELFERQVDAHPDRPAVRFGGAELTYRQLDAEANRVARHLRALGVTADGVVGMLLERGLPLTVAQLGILKAGGGYLPLDPTYPDNRLAFQLDDASCRVVLTTTDLAGRLPAGTTAVCLDDPATERGLRALPDTRPAPVSTPDNLAYLIYPSGSTGRPKGVLVEHRSVVNFTTLIMELFAVTPEYRVLQFANPAFDVSVFEIFSALCGGATLVQAPREVLHDPVALAGLLRDERVTMADIPPSVLALMDGASFPDLRVLFVGLEPYPGDLVNQWNVGYRQFHNGYGPTEATVACINYHCPHETMTGSPPIGVVLPNYTAYVLDPAANPVPVGVAGELYVGGVGVARGYLNRPGLTAQRFVPDGFGTTPGARLYRTGDLVRWRPDGNMEFLGRVDDQVKIRGLRVEPSEIEHVLRKHPAIGQAAVLVQQGDGGPQLVAYVVVAGEVPAVEEVRAHLAAELPPYMIPSAYVVLPSLPLTANGKLDKAKLPAATGGPTVEYQPPTTPTQETLVEIWRGLLGVERIGILDNFFSLGGNSLQATQLVSRIRDAFDVTVDLRTLFTNSTVAQLADLVEARELDDLSEEEIAALLSDVEDLSDDEAQARLATPRGGEEGA